MRIAVRCSVSCAAHTVRCLQVAVDESDSLSRDEHVAASSETGVSSLHTPPSSLFPFQATWALVQFVHVALQVVKCSDRALAEFTDNAQSPVHGCAQQIGPQNVALG